MPAFVSIEQLARHVRVMHENHFVPPPPPPPFHPNVSEGEGEGTLKGTLGDETRRLPYRPKNCASIQQNCPYISL